jgi:hypothetical protein
MSRKRNRKRRKARKERSEIAKKRAEKWVRSTPGTKGKIFHARERSGDAAELNLTFGDRPLPYDEDGEIGL